MIFKINRAQKKMIVFLARHIADSGGRAFFVGGVVRDRLLGRKPKDIDVEVYGSPWSSSNRFWPSRGR